MYEIIMYISVIYIFDTALPGREYLGLLDTPGGDKVVEDPIIESFYKVATSQFCIALKLTQVSFVYYIHS